MREQVAGHIENFYYLMAKMRAHFLRLPKELQKRIELGLVKSFDQVTHLVSYMHVGSSLIHAGRMELGLVKWLEEE
jgi:hypothetical protein